MVNSQLIRHTATLLPGLIIAEQRATEAVTIETETEETVAEAYVVEEMEIATEEAVEIAEETLEEVFEMAGTEAAALEPMEVDHAAYIEAELDTPVIVETYVQATQSWWNDSITVYAQSEDGAYFIYGMACSEEDAEKLVPGQKIRVTGYKSEWSGEVEIIDATFELLDDDTYEAEAIDVTDLLGTDELADHQNEKVTVKGATVVAKTDSEGNELAFFYNWDNSGTQEGNSDLYFDVDVNGETYTFTVESYLCDNTTDVYKAVEALEVGDVIDLEGFLYWYEGAQLHTTSVVAAE